MYKDFIKKIDWQPYEDKKNGRQDKKLFNDRNVEAGVSLNLPKTIDKSACLHESVSTS